GETLPAFNNLMEGYQMIRNTAEEWKQQHHQAGLAQGMAEGVAQGMTQGEQTLLLRQLRRRFGDLSTDHRQRLENASLDELETWADRILDAKTLDDIFQ